MFTDILKNTSLIILLSVILAACGGGSSDSGAESSDRKIVVEISGSCAFTIVSVPSDQQVRIGNAPSRETFFVPKSDTRIDLLVGAVAKSSAHLSRTKAEYNLSCT